MDSPFVGLEVEGKEVILIARQLVAYTDIHAGGDEIIIQPPVYPPFHSAVSSHGRKLVYNTLINRGDGYEFNFDELVEQTKTAKMLILCNPHNPVGRCWTRNELLLLGEICMKNNVLVISDEIHCDLVLPGFRHHPFASLEHEFAMNSITFHAASKTFNLAGLATSTAIIPNEELRKKYVDYVEALEAHLGNIFGKVATQAAMTQGDEWLSQLLDYVQGNIDYVSDFLTTNLPKVNLHDVARFQWLWLDRRGTLAQNDPRSATWPQSRQGLWRRGGQRFLPHQSGLPA